MTDLNKLRSEFEAVTETYHCIYNADLDYYFSGSKFVSDKAEIEVNAGWKAWKKAKAQAVPNEIINKIQSWVAVESFAAEDAHPDLPIIDANELAEFIEQLVKSESGAEG
ncbi:hypothetical protein [Acinetobacter baumannii]|uniref:hypothetical protein n=1 Tax=Acinetobacter baumannii TaxID=470 RepID=UPI00090BB19D|nr:hypothetical protein [Acinetobacter baumannii]APJ18507.1 hypothetical protein BS064_05145 [Acinetobacter baumannii]EKX8116137.1 hypothetical protein [Acinetobacter baumannii]MDI6494135.1 hypothetical protein [Acinetobacter baumannii]HCT8642623.1 hypothetical protein [Acinetobacter baumannii]HCT8645129.1 hypothetical protein [Acinetobacter baumannii]